MTEDDTYRALIKPNYDTMLSIWANSDLIKRHGSWPTYHEDVRTFFRKYGWDVEEYSNFGRIVSMDR